MPHGRDSNPSFRDGAISQYNKTETIWEGEMLKYKVEFNVQFV